MRAQARILGGERAYEADQGCAEKAVGLGEAQERHHVAQSGDVGRKHIAQNENARACEQPPEIGKPVAHDSLSPVAPFRVVNIAGGRQTELMDFIRAIEAALGQRAQLNMLPMQPGDVVETQSDTRLLQALIGEVPETPVETGVARFVDWFRDYYRKEA